jgi:hypothetical protein
MHKALLLTLIGLVISRVGGMCAEPRDLHIYLLIGQSNMAGRATITEEIAGEIPRCFLLNGEGKWLAAKNPLNRYSTIRKGLDMQRLGPGYSFAKSMVKDADPVVSLGLVVNAKGGTKIEQWAKGTSFYNDALKRVEVARKSGVLKGILWHRVRVTDLIPSISTN